MLHACQPSVIRTEASSFWRLKCLSFEGHLEKKCSRPIFLVIKCKQRLLVPFRQFVSSLAMTHNDVGETALGLNLY